IPLARWERTSRLAGVVRGDDWDVRLGELIDSEQTRIERIREDEDPAQWQIDRAQTTIDSATGLRAFIAELRSRLQQGAGLTSWAGLSSWVLDLFHTLIAEPVNLLSLPAEEQHAAARVELTLTGLADLDTFGQPASLRALRDVLDLELSTALPRVGTFGTGVFVAPLASAVGLDADAVYV